MSERTTAPIPADGKAAAAPPIQHTTHTTQHPSEVPTSVVAVRRLPSPAWLIPLVAVAFAALLFVQSREDRGPRIVIQFENGSGIETNDPVTFRGVRVGTVRSVTVAANLMSVRVEADLRPDAEPLARVGTSFWIVRPEVSLTRIAGLETLVGPRYIAAEPTPGVPGSAKPKLEFIGLEKPPRSGSAYTAGDPVDVVLRAQRLGSITENSPVTFRDMKVGSVTRIALSEDARRIDVGVRIEPQYAHLVRSNTKFWNVSGIDIDMGIIHGLKLKAESLETVLAGGIALATPNSPGPQVTDGHQFDLETLSVEDWLKWSPDLSAK